MTGMELDRRHTPVPVCELCRYFWPCPPALLAGLPGAMPEPIDWGNRPGPFAEEPPF